MTIFHTITGLVSLFSGLALVLTAKGSRRHRGVGKIYVVSMYALCLTSFGITDPTPYFRGYGMFHLIAAVGVLYLTVGMIPLLFRRRLRDWFAVHFYCMLWSYVGLIMALNAHFFQFLLYFLSENLGWTRGVSSIASMLLLWGLPLVAGTLLINRKMPQYRLKFIRRNQPAVAAAVPDRAHDGPPGAIAKQPAS